MITAIYSTVGVLLSIVLIIAIISFFCIIQNNATQKDEKLERRLSDLENEIFDLKLNVKD